jgi:hypothetical protein
MSWGKHFKLFGLHDSVIVHFGKSIFNNHVSIAAMTIWWIKPSGTTCLPEEISIVTENVNTKFSVSDVFLEKL